MASSRNRDMAVCNPNSSSLYTHLRIRALAMATSGKQTASDSGLRHLDFHLRVKMSTSRKLVVKLDTHLRHSPKHSCAPRKGTSTEAAKTIQSQSFSPWPNKPSIPPLIRRPLPRGELSLPAPCSQVLNLFSFSLAIREKNHLQFVHLHISEPTPGPSAHDSRAGIAENFAVCPLKFGPIFTLFLSHREQRQVATKPDSEPTKTLRSL